MELAEQIRTKFAGISGFDKRAEPLGGFEGELSSWAIKLDELYAVGIEIDESIKINETFANVFFYTGTYSIDGERKYLLVLASPGKELRNEFAGICALFLEPGPRGEKRKRLRDDPLAWWKSWKNLLGNKNVEKSAYSVLSELLVLYHFKKEGADISADSWTGPNGKSVDIRTAEKGYEVKSSLIKYNDIVTISGQYQLESGSNLSLIFVKLEDPGKEAAGKNIINIDYLLDKLSGLGLDYTKLNDMVKKTGFKENSLDRKKHFRILELREYPIDDEFPYIDVNALRGIKKIEHIIQVTYKVDLKGIDNYKQLELDLS